MNQHQRKRENWVANFGERFLAIWNDDSLTNSEKLNKLNVEGIPTIRNLQSGWTYDNARKTAINVLSNINLSL